MAFEEYYSQVALRLSSQNTGFWGVHERASEKLAEGQDVILLSVGDPDLPTLDRITHHAIDSLKSGRTHYSPGRGEYHLRQTIAEIETRASGKKTEPEDIIVFPGATNAIYSVMMCLLNEGDEVLVPEPMYLGYYGIFGAIGASIVRVQSTLGENFSIDVDRIKQAVTAKTKVVFLNTPGNPSGHVISSQALRELSAFCFKKGIWIVCDEVYSMITFEKSHESLRKSADHLENVVIVDGLSKSHAMTGWRMGWTVGPGELNEHLLNLTSSTIFGCCQFVQDAAAFALQNDEEYIQQTVQEYRSRRDYAFERLAQIPDLSCQLPEAGMFLMIDVSQVNLDGYDFAERLLKQENLSVLPGEAFGKITKRYVRLSLTQPVEVLGEAIDRLERFTVQLKSQLP